MPLSHLRWGGLPREILVCRGVPALRPFSLPALRGRHLAPRGFGCPEGGLARGVVAPWRGPGTSRQCVTGKGDSKPPRRAASRRALPTHNSAHSTARAAKSGRLPVPGGTCLGKGRACPGGPGGPGRLGSAGVPGRSESRRPTRMEEHAAGIQETRRSQMAWARREGGGGAWLARTGVSIAALRAVPTSHARQ